MDVFCLDPKEAPRAILHSYHISWIPDRPRGLRLSRKSFANTIQIQNKHMILNFQKGRFGLLLNSSPGILDTFCLSIGGLGKVHPHIKLHVPYTNPKGSQLYVYSSSTASQTIVHGTQNFGSAFLVRNVGGSKRHICDLIYHGTLSYDMCWSDHKLESTQNRVEPFVTAGYPKAGHRMKIVLGTSSMKTLRTIDRLCTDSEWPETPTFRRPPNAAKWGDKVTPKRVLWYLIASIIWCFLTLALFIPQMLGSYVFGEGGPDAIIPTLGWISLSLGLASGVYTVVKQIEAPRQWLRSYFNQYIPTWIHIFAAEEQFTHWLKSLTWAQQVRF